MNTFNKVIQKRMSFYNNDKSVDKLKQVQGEIGQVKDVMTHNIEQVLGRGRRIDIIADRTDALNQKAFVFKRRSILLKVKLLKKIINVICCI
jgi:vesicle-associated membrane protein 7